MSAGAPHLYRIAGRHGVTLVAAGDPIAALGAWRAAVGRRRVVERGEGGRIVADGIASAQIRTLEDTVSCRQVPDELVVGPGAATAAEVAAEAEATACWTGVGVEVDRFGGRQFGAVLADELTPGEDITLALGGAR